MFACSASREVASPIPLPMMPPTDTAPSCWVRRLKPIDGRGRVRGLVVRDGEVELPPLPPPLDAARPVDLVHGERRTGADLEAPWREVRCERREHAELDRASLRRFARSAVGARSAQDGGERDRSPRPQSICTASRLSSFRRACHPGLPDLLCGQALTRRRAKSCADRGRSRRLGGRVSRTSAHVYNTVCAASSVRPSGGHAPLFAYKRDGLHACVARTGARRSS